MDPTAISPGMAAALRYLAQHGAARSANRYRRPARLGEFEGKTLGVLRRRGWVAGLGQLGTGGPLYALTPFGADIIRTYKLDDARLALAS